ncbi:MAG: pyridoxal-5'-phosphate-dependent protein [Micavibrio aeruginosavorus]|uniref:threonine ammonia-lyase n=1 Tax=Micavibrio aeruginosavorus TaxID=349221 RepID=A0A2W5N473_9BACT|nr:MAG: pyridoxal-5'-phosphate-dependent protein [Micavibrio aeruginosavorus]
MTKTTAEKLFEEALRARTRVYQVGDATPLEEIRNGGDYRIFVKREDLGPINAYKWRGAYNAVRVYHEQTGCKTVIAASAGNHAQGVAMAAKALSITAKIFMPLSTPMMKQSSVKKHGGDSVEIVLHGDTYNEAADAAKSYVEKHGSTYIHPFDDMYTMAGQATIADEIMLSGDAPFDFAFLQIGGGGMAGAVAAWLKLHNPNIKIIGVEGVDQACMKTSVEAGQQITLNSVDTFCDGTAVTRPGDIAFEICRHYIDAYITVTNEEVAAAIQKLWDAKRVIPEPSGAMGLAGLVQYAGAYPAEVQGKKLLCVLSGANMDFGKLSQIAQRSAIGSHRRRYLRFHIGEKKGGLLGLLDKHFKELNVSEFLYGKIHENEAWPIIGLEAAPERMEHLDDELLKAGVRFEDITLDPDIRYRIINYNAALFKDPVLMHIQFPERKGALRDLLRKVSGTANVCYFNYANTGDSVGSAIMGFEFDSMAKKDEFFGLISDSVVTFQPLEENAAARILQY